MPELNFEVQQAESVAYAAAPQMVFKLRIWQAGDGPYDLIQAIALNCQIRIEPTKRRYDGKAHDKLHDVFGAPERWSKTLRHMLWTHASMVVPTFTDSIVADLPVPCTYDFNLTATRYFDALSDGDIPLSLLFSGTIFYQTSEGELQIAQISWDKECAFRLPVQTWREMMDHYYPNCAWLCLRRDVFDGLLRYKSSLARPTWEHAVETLLAEAAAAQPLAAATSEAPP